MKNSSFGKCCHIVTLAKHFHGTIGANTISIKFNLYPAVLI